MFFKKIDLSLFFLAIIISIMGLSVIYSFDGENSLFYKQIASVGIASIFFFLGSKVDIYFFKNSNFITFLYFLIIGLLVSLFFFGSAFSGAQSWFSFGGFTFQPTELAKIVLVLLLSKYFFKRHVEIKKIKHLIISGIYAGALFLLLVLQPDFGSAMIVFFIWFSFIFLVGIPKKYIFLLIGLGGILFLIANTFLFSDYQKDRINTFLNPQLDSLGAGYNISQANIALGNGGFLGQGISLGSQSRLNFLPEAKTDFIFSAFGEEWGFLGIIFLFLLFILIIYKIVKIAIHGRTNFESLFASGIAIYFIVNFCVHIGINLEIIPVTGTTLPFMSYGGSHLIIEFFALGLVGSISKTNRSIHRNDLKETHILE